MQDLASFLLVRGRYAWLGYGWQGCTNGDTHSASGSGYGKWGTELDEDYGEPLVREKTAAFSGFPCVFVPSLSWQIILFIWNVLRHGRLFVLRKTAFLRHLYLKTNILPRQALDKHRENSKKDAVFRTRSVAMRRAQAAKCLRGSGPRQLCSLTARRGRARFRWLTGGCWSEWRS